MDGQVFLDDDDDDDNTGGGGIVDADKITHGPYKLGDWYNDGKNEGWVYCVTDEGYHGRITSGHIGYVLLKNLNAYKDSIPEGWSLLSLYDVAEFSSGAQYEIDTDTYYRMYLVKPELTGLVRQLFAISSLQSLYAYAGEGIDWHDGPTFVYVFIEVNGQLGVIDYRSEGLKEEYGVNLCLTYNF